MAKIIPISEHFQHFLAEMKESFWGDLYGQTKLAWQRFFELQSERQRDRYSGWGRYERRRGRRRVYRNGYYEGDFVTRFGTIRLRVARTREKSFLPRSLLPASFSAVSVAANRPCLAVVGVAVATSSLARAAPTRIPAIMNICSSAIFFRDILRVTSFFEAGSASRARKSPFRDGDADNEACFVFIFRASYSQ